VALDTETRRHLRIAVDSAVRRQRGLDQAVRVRVQPKGSRSRRWTEQELRTAVLRAGGGTKITAARYEAVRVLAPNDYPSYNTVHKRCPDLFL
jgi:hypothetical protein